MSNSKASTRHGTAMVSTAPSREARPTRGRIQLAELARVRPFGAVQQLEPEVDHIVIAELALGR